MRLSMYAKKEEKTKPEPNKSDSQKTRKQLYIKEESFVLWQQVTGGIQTSLPYLTFAFTSEWTGRQQIAKEAKGVDICPSILLC